MSSKKKTVILLILICIVIAILPLLFIKNTEFSGADGKAEELISEIDSDYEPWTNSLINLPGGETETLLFCLQSAIGAGIIGYGFGVLRQRSKYEKERERMLQNDSNR